MKTTRKRNQIRNGRGNYNRGKRKVWHRKIALPDNGKVANNRTLIKEISAQVNLMTPNVPNATIAGKTDLTIDEQFKHAVATGARYRPFREYGPDEVLHYEEGPNPIFRKEDYPDFREIGPEFINMRFMETGTRMDAELWFMLGNCELLGTRYYEHTKSEQLDPVLYGMIITIWNYLMIKGLIKTKWNSDATQELVSPQMYYAVKEGRQPGIYLTWLECKEQIRWHFRPQYKGFDRREKAEQYLRGKDPTTIAVQPHPYKKDICTWATYNRNHTAISIRAVRLKGPGGRLLLFDKSVPVETPLPVAEFLALVETLKFCKDNGIEGHIYNLSEEAVTWVNGFNQNPLFADFNSSTTSSTIKEAVDWLKHNRLHNTFGCWLPGFREFFKTINDE